MPVDATQLHITRDHQGPSPFLAHTSHKQGSPLCGPGGCPSGSLARNASPGQGVEKMHARLLHSLGSRQLRRGQLCERTFCFTERGRRPGTKTFASFADLTISRCDPIQKNKCCLQISAEHQ